jgi:hypothetical protein
LRTRKPKTSVLRRGGDGALVELPHTAAFELRLLDRRQCRRGEEAKRLEMLRRDERVGSCPRRASPRGPFASGDDAGRVEPIVPAEVDSTRGIRAAVTRCSTQIKSVRAWVETEEDAPGEEGDPASDFRTL